MDFCAGATVVKIAETNAQHESMLFLYLNLINIFTQQLQAVFNHHFVLYTH